MESNEAIRNILYSILVIFVLVACRNKSDINKIVSNHWQQDSISCIVDFSFCFSFDQDVRYYLPSKCSLEEIDRNLGMQFSEFEDISDRIIFVHDNRITYTQDWYYTSNKPQIGAMLDHNIGKLKMKKRNAKFRVKKKRDMYSLVPVYEQYFKLDSIVAVNRQLVNGVLNVFGGRQV